MIKKNKCFGKIEITASGIFLFGSFAILLAISSQSQYGAAQNPQPMMEEMKTPNQTNANDMNKTDSMGMMSMMMDMMDMMDMMMKMMNMSSDMSNSTGMHMSNPMSNGQGGSNMSMMNP